MGRSPRRGRRPSGPRAPQLAFSTRAAAPLRSGEEVRVSLAGGGGREGGGKMTFPRNSWSRGGWGAGSEPRPRPLREGPGLGLVPPTACLRWRPPPLPLTSLAALEKHPHCRHGNRGWRRLRQEPAERRCRPLPRAGDASLPPSPLLAPSPPESAFPCGGTAGGGAAGKKGLRGKRRRGGELVLAAPPFLAHSRPRRLPSSGIM